MIKKYWPGIIPAIMILYFPLKYFQRLSDNNSNVFPIVFLGFIFLIILGTIVKNNRVLSTLSNLKLLCIYFIFLTSVLLFTSYFSESIFFSITYSMFSILTLGLFFISFYFIQYFYLQNVRWQRFFEITSIVFLVFILLGQVFISEWTYSNELRLSGGINPNQMSFFAFYFLFQSHVNALLIGRWNNSHKITWLLSSIIIIWTFSRTAILSIFMVYFIYFLYFAFTRLRTFVTNGLSLKKIIRISIKVLTYGTIIVLSINLIYRSEMFSLIQDRFTNIDNVASRSGAWKVILPTFYENPIFGGYGWWGSTEILSSVDGVANSSHNFFVRVLSEVGLVGLLAVISLPIYIIISLLKNNKRITTCFGSPIAIYLSSVLISIIFITQVFEDRYLSGIFQTTSEIITWFLSLSLIIIHLANEDSQGRKNNVDFKNG